MLADTVDAVIGVDTYRDTHHAEIAHPSGAVIATCSAPNTSGGYAHLLSRARERAPGPRLAACIEGTRSYGAGLARAAPAAGLTVIECEQPTRQARRGKGKSDPITRHRLNRGGDRALNRALHVVATTRMRDDAATRAYLTRRRAEGKTDREIRRCLKRYIARQLYRALTATMAPAQASSLGIPALRA